jgi:hypothetical protein
MAAIVTVTTTSDDAWKALLYVAQVESIDALELGRDSGVYQVVFKSASVQVGTGYDTLRRLMDEHSPGAGAGLERVDLG